MRAHMRHRLRLDRLAAILAASRLSQNHWAIRLGLSRGHWSDIVNGRHPYPSAKTRERMLEAFGVAADELFTTDPESRDDEFELRMAIASRYEITSELGHGGMGTVYLANDRTLGRLVALKVVSAEAAAGVGADQLLQEIALVSRLQHPNILPLFDAGARAGSPYYVMPYVRGGSLGARLRASGRLPLSETLALLDGIAAGVAYAHEQRILHCDIKPENVLLDGQHAFVMDFGIARKLHSEADEWATTRRGLDLSAGTPAYVSPEQAAGDRAIDERSDVYSLACVVYEMLSGRAPFMGSNTQEIVCRRFHESPPALGSIAPEVPPAVVAMIERAMSVEPSLRPSSPVELAKALLEAKGASSKWRPATVSRAASAVRRARTRPTRGRRRGMEWLSSVKQDVAYAVRHRRRAPALTAMAILTLALGIGLTTAVFAVVDGVMLRRLPYENPDRLVSLMSVDSAGQSIERVSSANWHDWKDGARTVDGIALYMAGRVSVIAEGRALRADAQSVSPEFFEVVRPRMATGRAFAPSDTLGGGRVAVVSEEFWQRELSASRARDLNIQVNGFPYTITGILSRGQGFPDDSDIWVMERLRRVGGATRNNINWGAIARLKPGTTIDQTRAELSVVARRIREAEPVAIYSYGVHVEPLKDVLVSDSSDLLRLLMGTVVLVLLIVCANLSSANLAEGSARAHEMAIRAALGARRQRLVRQSLIEHLLVALTGGAVGAVFAWWLTKSATVLGAAYIPRANEVTVDPRVLIFAFLVSAMAGLLTGLAPAINASRAAGRFEGSTRGAVAGGRGLPGRALVAAEVALALMLVAGAGLLVQSLRTVLSRPLGFTTHGVVTAEITLSGPRYVRDTANVRAYWRQLTDELRATPGVAAAGLANWVPLVRGGSAFIEIGGRDVPGAGAGYRMVSEGYFEALDIPLMEGRTFDERDRPGTERVAVINRQMAERYWPGESPLGRTVRAASMEPTINAQAAEWITVIGVVADVRHFGHETDPAPEMFVLFRQLPAWRIGTMTAVVRGGGAPELLLRTVATKVREIDSSIPADLTLLDTHAARVTSPRRFALFSLGAFGVLALLLASVGVYGVLAFAVTRRTREMAVRAALGADRGRLLRLVLGSGARVIAVGIVAGLLGTVVLSKLIESMLFDVSPHEPMVLVAAVITVAVSGLLAALIPARRAVRIAPMEALRDA
jgi:putative ABC transport system permease protein